MISLTGTDVRWGQGPPVYRFTKRLIDITLCLVALPLLLVVLLVCCLAIRIDSPGPVFFRQERTGLDGRRFKMYKFRTMVQDAEELRASLDHLNVLPPPDFKIINDPRITRVGRFLRETSLDELPQIMNVFLGDMSLVGPRPTSFAGSTYSPWHTQRLEALPGLTGLWQLEGRNATTFDDRLRMDIRYLDERSIAFDLRLIALTLLTVFRRAGV